MAQDPSPETDPARILAQRQQIEEQVRILSRFTSENPNPVLRVDRDGTVVYANSAGQILVRQLNGQVGEKAPPSLGQFIADVLGKRDRSEIQVEVAGRTFSLAVTPMPDADYVYLYGHDITRLKETERELIRLKEQAEALALQDALTGLPNRTLLEDRLLQAIAQCDRDRKKLALVFIDLDNFKGINETHGHRAGDQVLSAVARQIQAAVRKTDTVARWGGDEMILLLPGVRDSRQARAACERIKDAVQREMAKDRLAASLTLSMGLVLYPDDAARPELLLEQADTALRQAKARGRNAIVLYGESGESAGSAVG